MVAPLKLDKLVPGSGGEAGDDRTVSDIIIDLVRATGCAPTIAAARAGSVSRDTVRDWMKRGEEAEKRHLKGHSMTNTERRLFKFLCDYRSAHADWEIRLNGVMTSMARGGHVAKTIIREVHPTEKDADGKPIVLSETVKETVLPPSVAAIQWELTRKGKENYREVVEVTGRDGGPIEVSLDDRKRRLLAELEAYNRGVHDGATSPTRPESADVD